MGVQRVTVSFWCEESRLHWWPQNVMANKRSDMFRLVWHVWLGRGQRAESSNGQVQGSRVVKSALSTSSLHDLYELLYHFWLFLLFDQRWKNSHLCRVYRRPHRHASGVCSQLVCKSTHASQRIARVSRSCSRTRVQVLWFLWCMHGLSKFWLDSSKPFLILERVVPVAAMKFLLLLVAAARSAEKRFRLKQRVFYLEEAIWINSEVHDRNI